MRANNVPQRLSPPPGAHPESAAKSSQSTRFRTQDFEKFIKRLPQEKQNQARGLFPKDPTGYWIKVEEKSFDAFVTLLDPREQHAFARSLPALITCSRVNSFPAPGTRRPARGEDLHTPIASQRSLPLADLLAIEKARQNRLVPLKPRNQNQPNRVGFTELAQVRLYPIGQEFNPGDFHVGWPHELDFSPKGKPGKFVPTPDAPPIQLPAAADATVPKAGKQGKDASFPLHNESYPSPPPQKGILKKPVQVEEHVQEPAQDQKPLPKKMPMTRKIALGTTAAVATLATFTIIANQIPSDAPDKT